MERVGLGLTRAHLNSRVSRKAVTVVSLPSSWEKMGEQSQKSSDLHMGSQVGRPLMPPPTLFGLTRTWLGAFPCLTNARRTAGQEGEWLRVTLGAEAGVLMPQPKLPSPSPSSCGPMGSQRSRGHVSDSLAFLVESHSPKDMLTS